MTRIDFTTASFHLPNLRQGEVYAIVPVEDVNGEELEAGFVLAHDETCEGNDPDAPAKPCFSNARLVFVNAGRVIFSAAATDSILEGMRGHPASYWLCEQVENVDRYDDVFPHIVDAAAMYKFTDVTVEEYLA